MSEAEQLIAKADKKCAPVSGFASFFSGSGSYRFEEAADLYTQAANLYRIQRKSNKAGHVFEKAADAQIKADSKDEAANSLIEAYKCYKLDAPSDAARCLNKAVEFFALKGQFRRGANFKAELAELYETKMADPKHAILAYEEAGEWYRGDSAEALANKCYVKAADLSCSDEVQDFLKAAESYERIAKESLNNSLAKWSLKDYFFKAILCRLALNDYPSASALLERFVSWDPTFEKTREYEFALKLVDGLKEGDPDIIASASHEYDQISRLDNFKVKILNKIKNNIRDSDDLAEDDLT
ncbi:Alpha-soluble NSF attachment protein (SNAP-alpha) (N-ethylmaleimide-sensitive factor attachment protein alpha) (Vesicular-fusion protein SEC17) (alpha-SNAP chaperone) [Komagataella phaffii CBS 7435]|uniref:Vesicular-fusion protein SEC17 n=2 Tax=Komagataella phaffii TaxID=460519 RepID=SEC17_KOMPG|nr:Peripheral membrane protein required for vesicular transport between ER and Golgi [Komagataella phaffii GS115]Q9P4D0.2 RecName: Full=Vesicular-fusion protein SEC17 [Komagataella phaffii GS115]AOA62204.1 GQ67_00707T0 [Komagataella phaffii]CAH2448185.1 Alpha-soluble NSF attachment protein (SNAP-alpha) (N-ethylmaleimide-sensitive factor attachment protein alpha) (Vesicular-fusion protein SEC17) (alpha-SNAP chaperone) [Komagataella phaffii CBS 7435]AOA67208.1 GQ68_00682T0 [Komagataella phaffii G